MIAIPAPWVPNVHRYCALYDLSFYCLFQLSYTLASESPLSLVETLQAYLPVSTQMHAEGFRFFTVKQVGTITYYSSSW